MTADLHLHTTCSDGSASVEQTVSFAARAGLSAIAITDHDTMLGVERAQAVADAHGLLLLPGVELTTRDRTTGRPVHLLCYLPRRVDALCAFLNRTLHSRTEQKLAMVEKLSRLYPIQADDVLVYAKESAAIHECHIMRALSDMGYTPTVIGPLMQALIGAEGSCYVPSRYPDVREALEVLRACGGVSVVAHPGQFDSLDLVRQLADAGEIDGVEVWHPRNSEPVRGHLLAIAEARGLVTTGGSDFHGGYAKSPHPVGFCGCDQTDVDRLLALAGRR